MFLEFSSLQFYPGTYKVCLLLYINRFLTKEELQDLFLTQVLSNCWSVLNAINLDRHIELET